jgi:hypothetical protein
MSELCKRISYAWLPEIYAKELYVHFATFTTTSNHIMIFLTVATCSLLDLSDVSRNILLPPSGLLYITGH